MKKMRDSAYAGEKMKVGEGYDHTFKSRDAFPVTEVPYQLYPGDHVSLGNGYLRFQEQDARQRAGVMARNGNTERSPG